jgi:hypothetical protein
VLFSSLHQRIKSLPSRNETTTVLSIVSHFIDWVILTPYKLRVIHFESGRTSYNEFVSVLLHAYTSVSNATLLFIYFTSLLHVLAYLAIIRQLFVLLKTYAVRSNNSNFGFSNHVLNTGYTYEAITDTMNIVRTGHLGKLSYLWTQER